jgi:hypothetical protein
MCRADAKPPARAALAKLLIDIAQVLADQATVHVSSVLIGPVDLGSLDGREITA